MTEADEFIEKTAQNAEEPAAIVGSASNPQVQFVEEKDMLSPDEMLNREIDEIEAHWDDSSQWISSQQLWSEIKQLYPWANI
jgi:predicted RNA-binding protein with PIN domain